MSITRLSGGLTPGDGSDPRTFPKIFNDVADLVEAAGSDIDTLEGKNIPAFGTAVPSDGQVLTFDSAGSVFVPEDVAGSLEDLTDTDISSPATGQLLQYNGTNWVNVGQAEAGAIPVFADDDARATAIPTPSEGMVTFRGDQDVVEVFDGSAFKTVGGLVAVKSALFTGVQTATVNAGDNVAVTDLSITHEVSDPANRLIISAFFGAAGHSGGRGRVGIAVHDGSALLALGDTAGSRTSVTAGGVVEQAANTSVVSMPSVTFVHTPGAGSKTYTVRAINIRDDLRTLFINRSEVDGDAQTHSRAVSSLVIQEVAV